MRRLILGLAMLLAAAAAALAQPAREIATYELDNGLKVALAPDPTVPKVAIYLRYRVGSMNEPPGRSGFAHLFEHLMFAGTPAWPDYDGVYSAIGNQNNAWTFEDATVYYVEGMSANLPTILSVEADRMANLGGNVSQRSLDVQRAVVKNEMRQNVLDRAGASGWEGLWSGLFPQGHPYSRAVLGSMADLDAATLDDVRGFFNTYYVPNNAVLALVGDFSTDEARALIARTFGAVPRGDAVAAPDARPVEPTRVRLEVEDRLPGATVLLGHTGPGEGTPESGALKIAAEILGNLEYGYLRQRLVAEKGLASAVYASWHPGLLGGRFVLNLPGLPDADADVLERELKAAMAQFLAAPLDPADVERARRTLLMNARLQVEPYGARADAIAAAADLFGDARAALADDPYVSGATIAQIEAAMRAVLAPDTASVLAIRPGARGGYPSVLTQSSGVPQPFTAPDRPAVVVPVLAPYEPRPAEPPARQETVLSNGASLVHYRLPSSAMAYVGAVADGGWENAAPGREGLFEMAAGMAYRGAGGRDFAGFAKAAKDIGADIDYRAEIASTAVTLSVPGENFRDGAALLADAVLRPAFDPQEWRQALAYRLDTLAWDEAELANLSWWAALDRIFPPAADAPSPRLRAEALDAMTLDEAKAVYQRLFQPSSVTFFSVGPLPLETVAEGLETAFSGWSDTQAGFARRERRAATFPDRMEVVFVPEPGASQSAIEIVRPAPGLDQHGRAASLAVSQLLGGDFLSRLNKVIREEKGYSYGVSSGLMGSVRAGSALFVAAPVERDATGPAMGEMLAGFESLRDAPVTDVELTRTVTGYQMAVAGIAETGDGLFQTVLANDGIGISLEDYYERQRQVIDLDLETVRAQAVGLSSLASSVVVIAGDPDAVLPQLDAMGIEPTMVPRQTGARERSRAVPDMPEAVPQ